MSVVIQVDRLSKQYRLGTIGGKRLVDDVNRWWARVRGKEDPLSKVGSSRPKTQKGSVAKLSAFNFQLSSLPDAIWALKDVSFEVKQGEVLGIIGRNGAGKSTLLKILSRVTAPTSGEVRVKGRVASLLEVGTGFHPDLTGRENIFLNGAILGMTKTEIRRNFEAIVDFAEIDKFVDTPVKRYSSGMYVRLAFAVAAHLQPEILIVDEVLAVGDAEFQKKCLGKMRDAASHGRTVLFVSHNMQAVRALCTRGILLEAGEELYSGAAPMCIQLYESRSTHGTTGFWTRPATMIGESLCFESIQCRLVGKQPNLTLLITLVVSSRGYHKPAFLAVDILDCNGTALMQALPSLSGFIHASEAKQVFEVSVHLPPLVPGRYLLGVWAGSHNTETLDQVRGMVGFDVSSSPAPDRTFPYTSNHGFIVPESHVEPASINY